MSALWQSMTHHVLMLMFIMPLVGACIALFSRGRKPTAMRQAATINVMVSLALAVVMLIHFDFSAGSNNGDDAPLDAPAYQMVSVIAWTNPGLLNGSNRADNGEAGPTTGEKWYPDVRLAFGVDQIGLTFVFMTALLFVPAVMIAAPQSIQKRPPYYATLLMLQGALVGLFSALDVIFFIICLGSTTLLLYVLIGSWGSYERRRVINKFFVFNWLGEGLILLGLLSLVHAQSTMNPQPTHGTQTFSTYQLINGQALIEGDARAPGLRGLSRTSQEAFEYWNNTAPWTCLLLFLGFAIKIPLFPFHTWFAPAQAEAPSAVGLIMGTLSLKIGLYGMLRFVIPLFPELWPMSPASILMLTSVGCLFTGLLTLAQDDIKKLVACAALNQTIFAASGLFSLNQTGIGGALIHLLHHGAVFGLFFFLISMIEAHFKTRDIEAYSGWLKVYPRYSCLVLLCVLAIIGCPLLGGFPGQIFTLWGIYQGNADSSHNLTFALLNALGTILVVWSLLWYFQRVFQSSFREPTLNTPFFQGTSTNSPQDQSTPVSEHSAMRDISWREIGLLSPLVAVIVATGLFPQVFMGPMKPAIDRVLTLSAHARPASSVVAVSKRFPRFDESIEQTVEMKYAAARD